MLSERARARRADLDAILAEDVAAFNAEARSSKTPAVVA